MDIEPHKIWEVLWEKNPDYILVIKPTGEILDINRVLPALNRDEVLGTKIYSYMPPEHAKVVKAALKKSAQAKDHVQYELKSLVADKEQWWQNSAYPILKKDKVECFVIIASDITQRKQAEEYRDMYFNYSNDLMCIASLEGYFLEVNPAFTEVLGYSPEELKSKPYIEFVHPDDRKSTEKTANKQNKGSDVIAFENRYLRKDGSYVWLGWMSPNPEKTGGLVFAIARDLTKYKEAEAALKESAAQMGLQKKELERKNSALREILEQIEIEKKQIKEDMVVNIDRLMNPVLTHIKRKSGSSNMQQIEYLEKNLEQLTSSFGAKISMKKWRLTPREIEISNMIKNGLSSKEIAQMINVAPRTVEIHRSNIRKKLGLMGKNMNLASYLQNL